MDHLHIWPTTFHTLLHFQHQEHRQEWVQFLPGAYFSIIKLVTKTKQQKVNYKTLITPQIFLQGTASAFPYYVQPRLHEYPSIRIFL